MELSKSEGFEYAVVYLCRNASYTYEKVEKCSALDYKQRAEDAVKCYGGRVHVFRLVSVVEGNPSWRV